MTIFFNKKSQTEKRRLLRFTQTPSETILWSMLRNRKLLGLKFRRQFSIASYIVDFYCSEKKIAIEIDGRIHLANNQIQYDKLRQEQIEGLGIKFLRLSAEDVENHLGKILKQIKTVCCSK